MPHAIQEIIKKIKNYNPRSDADLLHRAYEFAERSHAGQVRLNGDPYIVHPLATANWLAEWKMDDATIAAGLLHDAVEDTGISIEEIEKLFSKEIGFLVEGVTKLGHIKYRGVERYVENLRKMFVAMAKDIRVIIIRFADRLNNLQTLSAHTPEKQRRIAVESLEIYAPIANRLGMGEIKGLIEDLSFPYVYPKEYDTVLKIMKPKLKERQRFIEVWKSEILDLLKHNHVQVSSMHGRTKHLYSLYQKLKSHGNDITKIYDLVALRIIVKTIGECYEVLGIIHGLYRPLKGRIKDYIAQPKPNGYRSLHTTVFTPQKEILEIQIRTEEIHEEAEFGIASHWHYKEHGGKSLHNQNFKWVRELAKLQKEIKDTEEYLSSLKLELFENRIFVFTPNGDVIDLPENATPIDFAYHIHTEVGHTCSGARINEHIAPLDTALKSGDIIEILKDNKRKGPNPEWLKFIKTTAAKRHIEDWISKNRGSLLKRFLFRS